MFFLNCDIRCKGIVSPFSIAQEDGVEQAVTVILMELPITNIPGPLRGATRVLIKGINDITLLK